MQDTTVFEMKGNARRLRAALAEMNLPVTHTDALNLVARERGFRNWERFESLNSEGPVLKVLVEESPRVGTAEAWLRRLEEAMLMAASTGAELARWFSSRVSAERLRDILNRSLFEQLQEMWLVSSKGRDLSDDEQMYALRRLMIREIEEEAGRLKGTSPDILLHPQSERAVQLGAMAVPASVSVMAGSSLERAITIDLMEWFTEHSLDEIELLLGEGLANTNASDDVALWLVSNGTDQREIQPLRDLLAYMEAAHAAEDQAVSRLVGITVEIDSLQVDSYVHMRRLRGR